MNTRRTLFALAALLVWSVVSWSQNAPEADSVKATEPQPQTAAADQGKSANPEARPAPKEPEKAGFHERHPRYRIQTGDSLELTFSLSPEFNQTVSVQPDGYISLRDAGDLYIEGTTAEQASQVIAKAYSKILRDPIVSVLLKDFEKPYFIAGGELKNPGKFELRGRTTVVQAIAIAGGFTESSKHSEVYLFRSVSTEAMEVKKLNVKSMLARANLSEDLYLKPGDVIWVPQNMLSKLKGFVIPKGGPSLRFPR